MFLQDFMAKKRFLHILASFLECKKAIFFKWPVMDRYTVYIAEIFLWTPLTQSHNISRSKDEIQKSRFVEHPTIYLYI